MKSAGAVFAQITWVQEFQQFIAIGADNTITRLDTRTQEQLEFDEAMEELETWLKSPSA